MATLPHATESSLPVAGAAVSSAVDAATGEPATALSVAATTTTTEAAGATATTAPATSGVSAEEPPIAEDPATHNRLIALLRAKGISFSQKHHAPTTTSQESAAVRGSLLEQGAKAMVLRYGGVFVLVVMSAARKLDLKAVKRELKTKSLSFATPEEVFKLTGCVKGAVPPFGSLWNIETLMDASLRTVAEIDFNAGLRSDSVHMTQADYEAVEKPRVVAVTEP